LPCEVPSDCETCLRLSAQDRFRESCDLWDDGAANLSCIPLSDNCARTSSQAYFDAFAADPIFGDMLTVAEGLGFTADLEFPVHCSSPTLLESFIASLFRPSDNQTAILVSPRTVGGTGYGIRNAESLIPNLVSS
jgi:hypothetical protein